MLDLNTTLILYAIITAIFLIVVFCIIFSIFNKKVLSKWHIDTKILFYAVSITFIMFLAVIYYCFSVAEFTINVYLILSGVFIGYTVISLITFYFLLKPVRDLQDITTDLASGKKNLDIELSGAKEFEHIEENLIEVQNNYKIGDKKLNEKDNEYQKYLPNNYLKLLNKTKIEQVNVGDNIKKDMSIMFCDVRDSFFSSGTMNLEENFKVINNFLGLVGKEVRKNKGFVDKFMGDGVLAVFENEEDALKSANSICEKIEYQNLVTIGVKNIDFGIAVHTGSVIIGVVGEQKRKSATIISDAVNLVSRIEHLNKLLKTKILFTKETLNGITDEKIHYRYVGTMSFDDLTKPIALFEGLDGYKGVKRNSLVKTKDIFETAVRSFEKEDYENAKKLFIDVLKNASEDYLSKFYLSKCNAKLLKK